MDPSNASSRLNHNSSTIPPFEPAFSSATKSEPSQPGPRPSSGYRSVADLIHPENSPPRWRAHAYGEADHSTSDPDRPRQVDRDRETEIPDAGPHKSLSETSSSSSSSSSNRRYSLSVIQQPTCAAEFGNNVLSRLPLAPPLIVKLEVKDVDGREVDIDSSFPFLFAHISLLKDVPDPTDTSRLPPAEHRADVATPLPSSASLSESSSIPPAQPLRLLYGTLVSSPHQLPGGGTIFVFPDVSIRIRGRYRLRVGLMRIAGPPGDPTNPPSHESLAHTLSAPFEVTAQTDYVAPRMTPLTGTLAEAGITMYLPRSHS